MIINPRPTGQIGPATGLQNKHQTITSDKIVIAVSVVQLSGFNKYINPKLFFWKMLLLLSKGNCTAQLHVSGPPFSHLHDERHLKAAPWIDKEQVNRVSSCVKLERDLAVVTKKIDAGQMMLNHCTTSVKLHPCRCLRVPELIGKHLFTQYRQPAAGEKR